MYTRVKGGYIIDIKVYLFKFIQTNNKIVLNTKLKYTSKEHDQGVLKLCLHSNFPTTAVAWRISSYK